MFNTKKTLFSHTFPSVNMNLENLLYYFCTFTPFITLSMVNMYVLFMHLIIYLTLVSVCLNINICVCLFRGEVYLSTDVD